MSISREDRGIHRVLTERVLLLSAECAQREREARAVGWALERRRSWRTTREAHQARIVAHTAEQQARCELGDFEWDRGLPVSSTTMGARLPHTQSPMCEGRRFLPPLGCPPTLDRYVDIDDSETSEELEDYKLERKPGATDQEYLKDLRTCQGNVCLWMFGGTHHP